MRAFVVLCLVAVAAAQYDYTPQISESRGAAVFARSENQLSEPIQPTQLGNAYSKQFYSYTAPEDEFDDAGSNDQFANSLKKALRVVFIKGPENTGLEKAALQLAKSAANEQTAIYVLNKQADISNLAQQLNNLKSSNINKPEVHFVKYRTHADAEHAQTAIQSQYDSLPGITSNSNVGDAHVLDFASTGAPQDAFVAAPKATYLPTSSRY